MSLKKFYKNTVLDCSNEFSIEYGYASKNTPQVTCLSGKTYVTTETKNKEILNIIDKLLMSFKKNLQESLKSTVFSTDFIFDYDFPKNVESGVKNKILNFDICLKNGDTEINDSTLIDLLNPLLKELSELFKFHDMIISKTKQ